MNNEERLAKSERIKLKGKETRKRHSSMLVRTSELKINIKKLSKDDRHKLYGYFIECKWLYNYLLSLERDELSSYDTKNRVIYSLDKDGNKVERTLTIPSKLLQAVYSGLKNNINALAKKKEKGGRIGKLKFKSEYNSIELNQYNNTHYVIGNNKIYIAGLNKALRVRGMDQIPKGVEFSNAKLVDRPSGIYLLITYYMPKRSNISQLNKEDIGLDYGIKKTITTSDGISYNVLIGEPERLKNLQRKLARQVKYSNSWYRTKRRINRCYEKIDNQKKDISNKIYHELRDKRVYMQDEMLTSWHSGRFSRQVQHSSLGFIKKKLIDNGAYVISRSFPSTKLCPYCGTKHKEITLSDRVFICSCGYAEDRDIKAAKTLLMYGRYLETSGSSTPTNVEPSTEHTGTQVERIEDFVLYAKSYATEHFSTKLEAATL